MVHSKAIWNAILETSLKTRWSVYYTIWNDLIRNCRQKMRTRTIHGVFWRHLKRFGTAENILKTRTVNSPFWRHLKPFGTAEKILNSITLNGVFWQYLKHCGTAENVLKPRHLKHAFWHYLKRFGTADKNENKDGTRCIPTAFETILEMQR